LTEWVTGAVGAIAALIGGWMYYAPSDGTLSLFGWDWDVADLADAWPFSLMIGGGVLLAAAFGLFAVKMYRRHDEITAPVTIGGLLALAAVAGAIVYLLIWIL
jgi:hypothetical protein